MATLAKSGDTIRDLWQEVWIDPKSEQAAVAGDRFTVEAYRRLRPFFTVNDRQILEAGCGTGRFCRLLAGDFPQSTVVGIDLSDNSVALARRIAARCPRAELSFRQASVFSLPYADDTFDVVFNEGVISLFSRSSLSSDLAAVREMTRVVKPGGKVVIAVANAWCLPHTLFKWWLRRKGVPYEYGYEKSYLPHELSALLLDSGLLDLKFSGFYPSYGFHRSSLRMPSLSRPLELAGKLVDHLDGAWLSRTFGFEVIAVGLKPRRNSAAV